MAVRESDVDGDEGAASKAAKAPSYMKLVIVGAVALFVALVGAQVTGPLPLRASPSPRSTRRSTRRSS